MTDKEYIQYTMEGNQAASEQLYLRHRGEFISFFRGRYGVDDAEITDLYQDAFATMWNNIRARKITEQTLRSSLKTYLYTIARNKIHNQQRTHRKTAQAIENLPPTDSYSAEEENRHQAIRQVVMGMQEPCCSVLSKFYWEGQSCKEIATELNYKNADTVKTQKYKCMRKVMAVVKSFF